MAAIGDEIVANAMNSILLIDRMEWFATALPPVAASFLVSGSRIDVLDDQD
nr:hypothetical protein [uncultured Pseudomonas sp.]